MPIFCEFIKCFQLLNSKSGGQNIFSKFEEFFKDTIERNLGQSVDLQSFNKLIILLPKNCEYDKPSDNNPKSSLRAGLKSKRMRESSQNKNYSVIKRLNKFTGFTKTRVMKRVTSAMAAWATPPAPAKYS